MSGTDLTFNIAWITKNTAALDKVSGSLDRIGVKLDELDHKKASPKVDLDTSNFDRKIATSQKGIDAFSQTGQAKLIALGGALAAGAVSGGALLAIPAAIAAVGVAAEKSNPEVVQSFGNLKNAAKETAQEGLSPLVPAFVQVANQGTSALGAVKGQLFESAQAAAPLVQIIGDSFLKAAQQGVGGAVPIIQSIRPVAQAAGDDLVKVEQGVMGLFDNINTGGAAQGLSILGNDLRELLPEVGQLVSEVVPLGNALLSVAGPALKSTADAAEQLSPALNVVANVVSFLGPDITAFAPPLAAAAAATKLLTGSWTDFGGAATKVKPILTDFSGTMSNVGSKLGISASATEKLAQEQAVGSLAAAENAKRQADLAVAEAEVAAAADNSTKSTKTLTAAQEAQRAAAIDVTAAEEELATANEAASFSFGPLGIALGAAALLALPFISSSDKATASSKDLSQQIIELGSAAPQAAANLASTNKDLQAISPSLKAVGTSATAFSQAYTGSLAQAQSYTSGLIESQKKLGDTVIGISADQSHSYQVTDLSRAQSVMSIRDLVAAVDKGTVSYSFLDKGLQSQVDHYRDYGPVVDNAKDALKNLQDAEAAQLAALQREGITIPQVTQSWNTFGNTVAQKVTDFNAATSGVKGITDNLVAADSQFFSSQQAFAQLDAAVVSAGNAYSQSKAAIADAGHSAEQAAQAVSDARHSEQQAADAVVTAEAGVKTALQGVVTAEGQVAQAKRASQQAEVALTAARKAAAQQLADLKRQTIDQGDSEAEARLRVLDAQNAVNAAGLNGRSLASLGAPTTANETNYQLLLALQEAQHNLNDVTAQGQQLADQNAAAQKAGVNGSAQVVAAQQALIQSLQQQASAAAGLQQAQAGVGTASKGVASATYAERQAHLATENAVYAERQAQSQLNAAKSAATVALAALQTAKAADSRETDLNSAAGVRNFQTVEQLFEDNLTATGDIGRATKATEAQGKQMGITKGSIDKVITSITSIPNTTKFSVIGLPSLDIDQLVRQATNAGISPFNIGIPRPLAQGALADIRGHATGGLLSGPGTGTSDSIVARVSAGEYIVNAKATQQYLPFLEAINAPGFASGGPVDPKSLIGVNLRLMAYDTIAQSLSNVLHTFGVTTPNLPKGNGKVDFGFFSPTAGPVTGLRGSRAANESIVQQVWANMFGWTGAEWAATIPLLMQESGFNNLAQNPTSTAFGMFQFLNSTWAGYGIPKTADPRLQAVAGGRYIGARYHDPIGALAHERAFNWYRDGGLVLKPPKAYDNGGGLPPGLTLAYNGTGRTENVRTGAQEDALLMELRALRADIQSMRPINVHGGPQHSVDQLATEVMRRFDFAGR